MVSQRTGVHACKLVAACLEFTGEGTKNAAAAYTPDGVTDAKAILEEKLTMALEFVKPYGPGLGVPGGVSACELPPT